MKKLSTAYLLWLPPLGFFGAHKFYVGKAGIGIFYLVSTLLGLIIFILSLIITVILSFFNISSSYTILFLPLLLPGIILLVDLFTLPKQVKDANRRYGTITSDYNKSSETKNLSVEESEKIVLQLARKYKGKITPVEIASESSLSIDKADEILKKLLKKGYADIRVSESGAILYEFSGFLTQSEKDRSSGILE